MDAVTAAISGSAASVRADIGNHKPARHVRHPVVADGHVGDTAKRADIWALVFRGQHHGEAVLGKASPAVL